MRKLLVLFASALLVAGIAGQASASNRVWVGTLKLELGTLPSVPITGTGVATVNGTSSGVHLQDMLIDGAIVGMGSAPVTDPANPTIYNIIVSATLGTGTISGVSGGPPLAGKTLAILGQSRICLFTAGCATALVIGLNETHTVLSGGEGGIGVGGLLTVGGAGAIRISIEAAPWTIGARGRLDSQTENGVTFTTTLNGTGTAHGPLSNPSSTLNISGYLVLISPAQVSTVGIGGANDLVSLFNALTFHFVPEPGMILLLGSGVAGLALLGRRRMRK